MLAHQQGRNALMASLLYGAGLRLLECVRLRVKDIELERRQIVVRDGKGGRDRVTLLPEAMRPALEEPIDRIREIHRA